MSVSLNLYAAGDSPFRLRLFLSTDYADFTDYPAQLRP